tara:strand:+ start:61 stop:963 length:903 start_codon:yes stop_codon:yes gene_type:complete
MNENYRPYLRKMSKEALIACSLSEPPKFASKQAESFYYTHIDILKNLAKPNSIKYKVSQLRDMLPCERKLQTEDTGHTFEYAICQYYDILYKQEFKYDIQRAKKIANKLKKSTIQLKGLTGTDIIHSADRHAKYDFTSSSGTVKIHAKTVKRYAAQMVAPEDIGQPCVSKFIQYFKLPITYNRNQIKSWIIDNPVTFIIEEYKNLFDAPICYFIEDKYECYWITAIKKLNIDKKDISFSQTVSEWNNNNTIYYKGISIATVQFHAARGNMAIRFNFKTDMKWKSGIFVAFPGYFDIKKLF